MGVENRSFELDDADQAWRFEPAILRMLDLINFTGSWPTSAPKDSPPTEIASTGSPRPIPHAWPRMMRIEAAAAYVGERSVDAFRRAVGKLWPEPIHLAGKGKRWLKDDLDKAIETVTGRMPEITDAADVL